MYFFFIFCSPGKKDIGFAFYRKGLKKELFQVGLFEYYYIVVCNPATHRHRLANICRMIIRTKIFPRFLCARKDITFFF